MTRGAIELSGDEARRLALRAQGLVGVPDRASGPHGVLRSLGAIQLDTISVLARTHELVTYARLGPVPRAAVEDAYWHRPARAFEYWAHAACLIPIEEWPWFALRRRRRAAWQHPRRAPEAKAMREVIALIREHGPITSADLGGSRKAAPAIKNVWWNWSPLKIAVERLLDLGTVVCTERRGWRRVYDLAERAIPARLLARDPPDEECRRHLVKRAAERMGVATAEDPARYFGGMHAREAAIAAKESRLVPVRVAGWNEPAWAWPKALETPVRGKHRTTLISPFDSLVWNRERTARVFGWEYRLESYTPAAQRVHGYFVLSLLAGGRLVGRVDPARDGTTLVVKQASLDAPDALDDLATALRGAARWVGCNEVRVGRISPAKLRAPLEAALR